MSSITPTNAVSQYNLLQYLKLYLFFLAHICFLASSYVVLSSLLWLIHNTTLQLFLLQLDLLMA